MEIRLVKLIYPILFRESIGVGGIICSTVYSISFEDIDIAIRITGEERHKKLTLYWFKQHYCRSILGKKYSVLERVKIIPLFIVEKVMWRHKISKKFEKTILERAFFEKTYYDNKNNS